MTGITKVDAKRRIVLPKDIIDEYGEEFVIIRVNGEIILKPLPKDPLKALREEGKKLKGVSWQQFEKSVEKRFKERT